MSSLPSILYGLEYLPRIAASVIEPPPAVHIPGAGEVRTRTNMEEIVKALTMWAKTEPFADETRKALLQLLTDLHSMHVTEWTFCDESQCQLRGAIWHMKNGRYPELVLDAVQKADTMLSRWQNRGGRSGNCELVADL